MPPIVPLAESAPVVYVSLDGATAPVDLTRRALSAEVEEHTRKATKLTLVLHDPDGVVRRGELCREGQVLAVRWGYAGRDLSSPRAGIIHKVEPSYADDTVRIEAFGRELALSRGRTRQTFRGQTFRGAVESLARDAGVSVRWEARDTLRFDAQTLHDETAWAWLQRRSAELGLEVLVEGETLVVREPPVGEAATLVLHYRWRNAELVSFEVETHTKRRQNEDEGVVAVFVDPASGQVLTHAAGDPNTTRASLAARRVPTPRAESSTTPTPTAPRGAPGSPDEDSGLVVDLGTGAEQPAPVPTATPSPSQPTPRVVSVSQGQSATVAREHVRRVAEGRYRTRDRGKVTAKATALGIPRARKGIVVQVVGVEPRDAGLWYVKGCTHKVEEGGYTTEFELTRDGVNGALGRRPSSAARQNQAARTPSSSTQGAPSAEPQVTVRLEDGQES